jgi:hypothetical protein
MFRVLTTDANEGVKPAQDDSPGHADESGAALRMVARGQKNRPKEE